MISNDSFERRVAAWFHADAEHRVPDHLDAVLRRTSTERQRPAWSSLERWLPMDTTFAGRFAPAFRPAGPLVVTGLLILLAFAAIFIVGSRQSALPAPFGPAHLGLIAYEDAGDIYLRDPVTDERIAVAVGPEWDVFPNFSPDGTKLVFLRKTSSDSHYAVLMVGNADGSGIHPVTDRILDIASGNWSGDGAYIAYSSSNLATPDPDDYGLTVVDVQRGTSTTLDVKMSVESVAWLPPRGQEIVFRGLKATLPSRGVWAVRPDGNGLHLISPTGASAGDDFGAPTISSDGRKLAYQSWSVVRMQTDVFIQDLVDGSTWPVPNPEARSDMLIQQFSPDASTLLLLRQVRDSDPPDYGGTLQLVLAHVGGQDLTRIGTEFQYTSVANRPDLAVTFSVDGTHIILLDRRTMQLVTLPVDGGPGVVEQWRGGDLPGLQRVSFTRQPAAKPCPGGGC
jgi:Tol biopolymer transport system component